MEKPIVLVIMDGVGKGDGGSGDAVVVAKTPTLDNLMNTCPYTYLKAHGTAVGLPSDEDMGNSEVGHNALGCGQVYSQGAKLVGESIENGALYASATWKELVANAQDKTLHFLGLLSDGNVHSNISHLIALLKQAHAEVYETAAPKGAVDFVVWAKYGTQSGFGDDCNLFGLPKVQIDIVTQTRDSIIADDIMAALWAMNLPYSVQSEGYDTEYNAFRTILQAVVT